MRNQSSELAIVKHEHLTEHEAYKEECLEVSQDCGLSQSSELTIIVVCSVFSFLLNILLQSLYPKTNSYFSQNFTFP